MGVSNSRDFKSADTGWLRITKNKIATLVSSNAVCVLQLFHVRAILGIGCFCESAKAVVGCHFV